jgi:xylulose-5-phosphate/fructose-6-phosphate phosphoketolase
MDQNDSENKITQSESDAVKRYRRAVNYLAAAQIYLKDNPLLEEPLRPEHIKDRLLGHWGTAPGINLIYAHLNQLILQTDASVLLITGPGHGAAANLANMYLEGTITEYFPDLRRTEPACNDSSKHSLGPMCFRVTYFPAIPE